MNDAPKSLGSEDERLARLSLIHEAHVAPLTQFVEDIRAKTEKGTDIPYFDPLDGGINAGCLFLLEAPGPKAVASGFVSRNNPDETAKNFFELNKKADIDRQLTVTWNIIPWYIGDGKKIRKPTVDDIKAGFPYFVRLLDLLPSLKVIVLMGKTAQCVELALWVLRPDIPVVTSMHTSPSVAKTKPENRLQILKSLGEAKRILLGG